MINRDDIDRKFGDFTYNKGGSVLRMVSEVGRDLMASPPAPQILTDEVFTAGLSTYLAAFSYSSTTEDDLFLHLEVACFTCKSLLYTCTRRRPWRGGRGRRRAGPPAAWGRP